MAKLSTFLSFLALTILATCSSVATPLDLNIAKKYNAVPQIDGFKYWYGDPKWGKIIYIGLKDIAGFETELHLDFKNEQISSALLILGPSGLDNENCIKEYKRVTRVINKKYGHYLFQKTEKDPLADDLISFSPCHPVQVGLYKVITIWKTVESKITSTLIGEDNEFFIEIEYQFKNKVNFKNKKLLKVL